MRHARAVLAALALAFVPTVASGQSIAPVSAPPLPELCRPGDDRIEVMLVGTYHMANPGQDLFNVEADDVLTPKRQREIDEVVDRLAAFRPTRVVVEAMWGDTTAPSRYHAYRAGDHQLSRNEREQIGFRLAARMVLPTVHGIDVRGEFPFGPVRELALSDSTLTPHLEGLQRFGEAAVSAIGEWLSKGTIGETLHRLNTPGTIDRSHEGYLRYFLPVVKGDDDAGATLLAEWYERNIRTFANLHRMDLEPHDRIVVVYGAGHVPILRQLTADSPYFCVEDPLPYLPAPGADGQSAGR